MALPTLLQNNASVGPDGRLTFNSGTPPPLSSVTANFLGLKPNATGTYMNTQGQAVGTVDPGSFSTNPVGRTQTTQPPPGTPPTLPSPGTGAGNIHGGNTGTYPNRPSGTTPTGGSPTGTPATPGAPPTPSVGQLPQLTAGQPGSTPGQLPSLPRPGGGNPIQGGNTGTYPNRASGGPDAPLPGVPGVPRPGQPTRVTAMPATSGTPTLKDLSTGTSTSGQPSTTGTTINIGNTPITIPAGSDPNNVYGTAGNTFYNSNHGGYTDPNGNPTTDQNWLNNQNWPDWLKQQYRWNPGDQNIGGGTPGHWELSQQTDANGHLYITGPDGKPMYGIPQGMSDPSRFITDPSAIRYDPTLGYYTNDPNAINYDAFDSNSWHSGDWISAGSIVLGGLAGGYFGNGFDAGGGMPAAASGGETVGDFGGTFGGGLTDITTPAAVGGGGTTAGAVGAGGTTTAATGGIVTGAAPSGTITVTAPAVGAGGSAIPAAIGAGGAAVAATGGGGGGSSTPPPNTTTQPPPNTTTQPPPSTTSGTPPKPSWFPGSQDTWNSLYNVYSAGRYAAAGITFANFVSGMMGHGPLIGGTGGTSGGTGGTSGGTGTGTGGGGNLGTLANTGLSWWMNNQLIQKYQNMFNDMYNKGDYNSQYRPGQLSLLNQFLTDPSKALQDPGYQNMRQMELDNESRTLNARGLNMSGNEMGDLMKLGTNLDYQHLTDTENQLRYAAQLGNPDAMARAGISSLPFMLGMMGNRNNSLLTGIGASGGVSGILNSLFGGKSPPTGSDGSFDFSQFTPDQTNSLISQGMPDPNQDPQGAQTWLQQFTSGNIPTNSDIPDTSGLPGSEGPPPDGFDSWDAFFAWLEQGGTGDGTGAGP